jgi:hypothetical protein
MADQVQYVPSIAQRHQSLMGCGVYFFRFMRPWFITPVGGWKEAHPEYLLRTATLPGANDIVPEEAKALIVKAQQRAAAEQRFQQARAQKK